jgi:general secretion pathway protein G
LAALFSRLQKLPKLTAKGSALFISTRGQKAGYSAGGRIVKTYFVSIDPNQRRFAGMTLIELLVVMAIILILVLTIIPRVQGASRQGKEATLREQLHALRNAIQQFESDCGDYPASLEQLVTRPLAPSFGGGGIKLEISGWQGPYVIGPTPNLPKDPFTGRSDSWDYIAATGDVHSGYNARSSMGDSYSDW